MRYLPALFLFALSPAFSEFNLESTADCRLEGLAEPVQSALAPDCYRVKNPAGAAVVEVRIHKAVATAAAADPPRGSDFPTLSQGALIGVIRYLEPGGDFCGKPIPPGVYTMRFSLLPEDGNHQGVAPRRDFVLLSPPGVDRDPAAKPNYDTLVEWSRKAAGAPHPLTLFLAAPESGAKFPGVHRTSEKHEILHIKSGDLALGIVVAGKGGE